MTSEQTRKKYSPSPTFGLLYSELLEELILAMIQGGNGLRLNCSNNDDHPCIAIGERFEEIRNSSIPYVTSKRLDRHKIAACLCGAIIEVKPLKSINNNHHYEESANAKLAIYSAINVIKFYMIFGKLKDFNDTTGEYKKCLKKYFSMKFPLVEENICDTKAYLENFTTALLGTQVKCKNNNELECNKFDVWAYSDIFYHLERYNMPLFDDFCYKYENGLR